MSLFRSFGMWPGLLAFLLSVMPLTAQNSGDLSVIRVTTRLVEVRLVASDGKGPVSSLKPDDFRLLDNGVERPIAFLSAAAADEKQNPPDSLPAGTFSNRPELRSNPPARLIIVVLDTLNTPFAEQLRTRARFAKYVQEIGPQDRMAVFVLGTTLERAQDFTNDHDLLAHSLDKIRPTHITPQPGAIWDEPTRNLPTAMAGAAGLAGELRTTMLAEARSQATASAFQALATLMGRIEGRKSLVWLSSNFPLPLYLHPPALPNPVYMPTAKTMDSELTDAARAIAKADISIYPVDVSGVIAPEGAGNVASQHGHQLAMDTLAAATGGRAFYSNNDLESAMRQAVNDAAAVYTLGFYPDDAAQDGKYHTVEVAVKRRGVQIRYRPGYVADGGKPEGAVACGLDAIRDAMASPLVLSGIRFRLQREPIPGNGGAIRVTVTVEPGDLALQPVDQVWNGVLEVGISQRDWNGRQLSGDVAEMNFSLTDQRYQTSLTEGLTLHRDVPLEAAARDIRLVLFDRTSGHAGSLDFPAR